MKKNMLIGLLTIPLLVNSPINSHNIVLRGQKKEIKNEIKFKTNMELFEEKVEKAKEKIRLEEIERKKRAEEEKRKALEEKKKQENLYNAGYYKVKEVLADITYYFAEDSALQGGHNDKKGKPLAGHGMAVCALPSDVPYGSLLVLDESVVVDTNFSKSNKLKNVDTGGAITWLNSSKTHMKVDVFIKGCYDLNWIVNNLKNKKSVKAKIYYAK